jgi:membrane-bound serine protease (ClpP class)
MFAYAIDVQTGVPRVWTGIATVSFTVGSLALYDGLSLSWITLIAGVVGMTLAMLGGMPAMVRTRFSTPTIGREWMVGEEGEARSAVDPEGTVVVRGAPWRARTNRSTPIDAGQAVRVASIEGLVLEVEPLEGAAKDHRRS